MKKKMFLIFLGSLVSSCLNNSIYFDIKEQSIKSRDSNDLKRVYIENDSLKEYYYIEWGDSANTAPGMIDLKNLNRGYNVYRGWNQKRIFVTTIRLSPFSKYSITNSQGDASTFKITVKTNENGDISWTSDKSK